VHEALLFDFRQIVNDLVVAQRAQRGDGENLRLTAGEHGGAVDTRQQINLAVQRTQLIELAAVRTDLLDGDQAADFRRFNLNAVFMRLLDHLVLLGVILPAQRGDFRLHLLDDLVNLVVALELALDGNCFLNGLLAVRVDIILDLGVDLIENDFHLRLGDRGDDFFLNRAQFLDCLMADHQGLDHILFGYFLGSGFNHVDGVLGAGDRHIHVGAVHFLDARVDDELAVNAADDDAGNRTVERNIGYADRQ